MHGRTGERMNTLKLPVWLIAVVVLCLLALATASVTYKVLYDNTSATLVDLRADVKAKNQEAADKLAELTDQKNAKQAALDRQATTQETTDAERLAEIERLNGELRDRPVRVRYVTIPSGAGSGGSASGTAATADAGAEDTSTTSGLLPPENTRRLAVVLNEIEAMSAAYSSCRERLIPTQGHDTPRSG